MKFSRMIKTMTFLKIISRILMEVKSQKVRRKLKIKLKINKSDKKKTSKYYAIKI